VHITYKGIPSSADHSHSEFSHGLSLFVRLFCLNIFMKYLKDINDQA